MVSLVASIRYLVVGCQQQIVQQKPGQLTTGNRQLLSLPHDIACY